MTDARHLTVALREDGDGVLRVAGTRVTLDTVVAAFNQGATSEEIGQRYPTLDLADIYAVIGYYLQHRTEVDAYLRWREQEADALRAQIEGRFDARGVRDRLLARRGRQAGAGRQ